MARIIFIGSNGSETIIEADEGGTLMEAAVKNGVSGIVADCGGACACATCHVYVSPEWQEKIGKAGDMEQSMLDFASEPRSESRLSCQITVTSDLDGLILRLPAEQG